MQKYATWLDADACAVPSPAPLRPGRKTLTLLQTWYERWQGRRDLADLDTRLLADIGLDQYQAQVEAAKPFWEA